MIRALVVGESHTVCLSQAVRADPQGMDGITVCRLAGKRSTADDGSISINQAVEIAKGLAPSVPVLLSIIGGYHNAMGLVRQDVDFDFLSGPGATMDELDVSEIVPWRAVADAFDCYIEEASKYLPVREAAQGPVFLIGTPPPKERNAFIIERFARANKQEYRGRNVVQIGVNTPRLRWKFWELECQRSKSWAESRGISYLSAPPEAFDVNGFLRDIYYEDVTHANMDYGALVLKQILEIVEQSAEVPAHG